MFAGREFRRREDLMLGGDQAIPIIDLVLVDLPEKYAFFLADEYTWVRSGLWRIAQATLVTFSVPARLCSLCQRLTTIFLLLLVS
jgi:hypothetical protein